MTDLYYLIPIWMLVGTNVSAIVGWLNAVEAAQLLDEKCYRYSSVVDDFAELFNKAQADLDAIHYSRHQSAKHARAIQIQRQRDKVAAKTAEIAGVPAEPVRKAA